MIRSAERSRSLQRRFTDDRSFDDAKWYNQYWDDLEKAVHIDHPGLTRADIYHPQSQGNTSSIINKVEKSVGKDMADEIFLEGYGRTVVNVGQDGMINVNNLD